MRRLFISYAREEKREVDQLAEHLTVMGYETWVDFKLRGGQQWWDEILRRIADTDVFVVVVSHASLNSTACRREFDWAEALRKPVLPVAVEALPAALPRRFAERQIVDYSQPEQRDRAALMLQGALATVGAAPPLPEHMPEPPGPPLSYLTELVDLVTLADPLDHAQQHLVAQKLSAALHSVDPEERRGGRDILERFINRADLYADVDRDVSGLRDRFATSRSDEKDSGTASRRRSGQADSRSDESENPLRLVAIAAVSRTLGQRDLIVADRSGVVYGQWASGESDWSRWEAITPPLGDVAALAASSADAAHQEVFALTVAGVHHSWWSANSGWSDVAVMHNPTSAPLTALASHSRQPGHQELFVADRSGRLFNRWRSDNSGWSEWHTRGSVDGRVTSMTSVADGPYSQEVFVLLESGELLSSWWTPRHGWSPWTEMSFPSDNDKIECLTSFSRHGGHVELVVVSHAGDQYNRWTFEGEAWSEWQLLEGWTGTVRALAAVQSDQWSVVVAAIRQDGNLSSALFWEAANSNNWRKLPRPESEQPPDTSNRD